MAWISQQSWLFELHKFEVVEASTAYLLACTLISWPILVMLETPFDWSQVAGPDKLLAACCSSAALLHLEAHYAGQMAMQSSRSNLEYSMKAFCV